MSCRHPWAEMVLSPAEDRVTPCCDYSAHGEALRGLGQVRTVDEMWNGAEMQRTRRIQAGREAAPNGCTGCPQSFDSPITQPADLFAVHGEDAVTPAQRDNLELARRDHAEKVEVARAWPVKYVVFSGWGCNITCRICNQVPYRNQMKDKLPAGAYQAWRQRMACAAVVECLGGEPFALPSGIAFMQEFVADRAMDHVRLLITTNATLVHKHLDWLKAKERVSFNVSIDSVGAGYEAIRVGGSWPVVEANLRTIQRLSETERPLWRLKVNALVTLTGLFHLPDYARFLADTGIRSSFHALRVTRGIEETLYQEDVLRYPRLLQNLPDWRRRLDDALSILRDAGLDAEAETLSQFGERLRGANAAPTSTRADKVLASVVGIDVARLAVGGLGDGATLDGLTFRPATIKDGIVFGVNFQGTLPADGCVTLRLAWAKDRLSRSRVPCQVVLMDQPHFTLQDWRDVSDERTLVKEVEAMVTGDSSQLRRLLLSVMAAKVGLVNVLPDRVDILARS